MHGLSSCFYDQRWASVTLLVNRLRAVRLFLNFPAAQFSSR